MIDQLSGFIHEYRSRFPNVHEATSNMSLFFEVYPLSTKAQKKSRIMLPITIEHGDRLPELSKCNFYILFISCKFSQQISDLLSAATEKQKDRIKSEQIHPKWVWRLLSILDASTGTRVLTLAQQSELLADVKDWLRSFKVKPHLQTQQCFEGAVAWSVLKVDCHGRYSIIQSSTDVDIELPSKYNISAYCKKLYNLFYRELVCIQDHKAGYTTPPHFGLVSFSPKPHYVGRELLTGTNKGLPTIDPSVIKDLLAQGPHQITIPLFSYTLFSVMKPFLEGYPSRLNDRQPYRTVVRQLEKIIYLEVDGQQAEAFSRLFCGTFLEYDHKFCPANYRKPDSPEAKRIHDGIVIYTSADPSVTQMLTTKQLTRLLLHDACTLLLHAETKEKDRRCIAICLPGGLPTPDFSYIQVMADTILFFTYQLENWWIQFREECFKKFWDKLIPLFCHYYNAIGKRLPNVHIGPLEEDEDQTIAYHPGRLSWRFKKIMVQICGAFCRVDADLLKKKYAYIPRAVVKDSENSDVIKILHSRSSQYGMLPSIIEGNPTIAALLYARFYVDAKKLYREHMPTGYISPIRYQSALNLLLDKPDCVRAKAENYAYLLTAYQCFCRFLMGDAGTELELLGLPVFRKLCEVEMRPETRSGYISAFSDYLSSCILSGSIIPVRSTPLEGQTPHGWYDGKKSLVYLPYNTYLDDVRRYCVSHKRMEFPFTKRTFQSEILYPDGLATPKDNGTKGTYLRYSAQVVVAPITTPSPQKETVIKISLDRLAKLAPFGADTQAKLREWDKNPPRRRTITIKG